MHRRKRPVGGLFSVIGIIFAIGLLSSLLISALGDNSVERRAIIPSMAIDPKLVPISSHLVLQVTAETYASECTINDKDSDFKECHPSIAVTLDSFKFTTGLFRECSISRSTVDDRSNCTVRFACDKCYFTNDMANVSFTFAGQNTYASAYYVSITASAGYTNQKSVLSYRIAPPSSTFFRGLSNPTSLTVSTVPTVYSEYGEVETGYHIDFSRVSLGELVDFRQFSSRNGMKLTTSFLRVSTSMDVVLTSKKSLISILSEILGSLVGLIGGIGIVMSTVEKWSDRIIFSRLRKHYEPAHKGTVMSENQTEESPRMLSVHVVEAEYDTECVGMFFAI